MVVLVNKPWLWIKNFILLKILNKIKQIDYGFYKYTNNLISIFVINL